MRLLLAAVLASLPAMSVHANETTATLQVSATVMAPSTTMSVALPAAVGDGTTSVVCPEGVCPKVEIGLVRTADGVIVPMMTILY